MYLNKDSSGLHLEMCTLHSYVVVQITMAVNCLDRRRYLSPAITLCIIDIELTREWESRYRWPFYYWITYT